jgi:hypothetical protein
VTLAPTRVRILTKVHRAILSHTTAKMQTIAQNLVSIHTIALTTAPTRTIALSLANMHAPVQFLAPTHTLALPLTPALLRTIAQSLALTHVLIIHIAMMQVRPKVPARDRIHTRLAIRYLVLFPFRSRSFSFSIFCVKRARSSTKRNKYTSRPISQLLSQFKHGSKEESINKRGFSG